MGTIKGILLVLVLAVIVTSRTFHEVVWNSRYFPQKLRESPLKVRIDDQLTIKCPIMHDDMYYEYAKLWMVSLTEYKHCIVYQPKWVGICNNNRENTYIKLVFRDFTPTPNGFEFEPYQNYYIVSTSTGKPNGLNQSVGGLCTFDGMKLKISVLEKEMKIKPTMAAWQPYSKILYQIHEFDGNSSTSYEFTWFCIIFTVTFGLGY